MDASSSTSAVRHIKLTDAVPLGLASPPVGLGGTAGIDHAAAKRFVERLLPADVIDEVRALGNSRHSHGALLLHGLIAVEALPPTPTAAPAAPDPNLRAAYTAIIGLGGLLGRPVAYAEEKLGALVQQVYPVQVSERAPSNESSTAPLDLHTELVFSRADPDRPLDENSPDLLLLLCLRSGAGAPPTTVVVDGRTLCQRVSHQDLAELRSRQYELQAPYSFTRDADGSRPWVGPVPLIKGHGSSLRLALDLACGTRALGPAAQRALDTLRTEAASPTARTDVQLRAGDVLIIDNRRCLHGRGPFRASYDGTDRWLLRMYVRSRSGHADDHEPREE